MSELASRQRILRAIERSPGLHFRELQRRLATGTGILDYHLRRLEKQGLVKAEKKRGNRRFFPVGFSEADREVLSLLRAHTCRHLLLALLEHPGLSHRDLTRRLELSPSSITWSLQRLDAHGLLRIEERGREKHYALADSTRVLRVLTVYHDSFLDRLVDKFIESFSLRESSLKL